MENTLLTFTAQQDRNPKVDSTSKLRSKLDAVLDNEDLRANFRARFDNGKRCSEFLKYDRISLEFSIANGFQLIKTGLNLGWYAPKDLDNGLQYGLNEILGYEEFTDYTLPIIRGLSTEEGAEYLAKRNVTSENLDKKIQRIIRKYVK